MGNELATTNQSLSPDVLESLVTKGDLSGLNAKQKTEYYVQLCNRVGLDPATQPFKLLKLNGKEIAYADKGAAEQLRKLHGVSISITARERMEDVYYVTARAQTPDGRMDESQGAVSIAGLKGENLANAVMKAETKSKRRATLSILGLGMLDESELDTIPANKFEVLQNAIQQPQSVAVQTVTKVLGGDVKASVPPLPEVVTEIPAMFLNAFPELAGIHGPLSSMSYEDLELVKDAFAKIAVKRAGKSSAQALEWFNAISTTAGQLLAERDVVSHGGSV